MMIILTIASYTDIKKFTIPNWLSLSGIILRLVIIPLTGFTFGDIGGAVVGFLILFIPALISNHAMGGDIKLITVMGLYLGIKGIIAIIVVSILLSLLYYTGTQLLRKKAKNYPYAPFLFCSFFILFIMNLR
jgi:Flp pilus assembly protein protease CpaA